MTEQDLTMSQFANKEDYYRAQFEREYCEEYPYAKLTRNKDGSFVYEQDNAMYRMWKRAKLEVRTVKVKRRIEYVEGPLHVPVNYVEAFEKAGVNVEFV